MIGLPFAVFGTTSGALALVSFVQFLANGAHIALHHKELGHGGLLTLPAAPSALSSSKWTLAVGAAAFLPRREHAVDGDAFVVPHDLRALNPENAAT